MGLIRKMLDKIKGKPVDTSGLGKLVDTRDPFEQAMRRGKHIGSNEPLGRLVDTRDEFGMPTFKIEKPNRSNSDFFKSIDQRGTPGLGKIKHKTPRNAQEHDKNNRGIYTIEKKGDPRY